MRKIKSFTLLELTVAMLLAGLVVTIAYSSFFLFFKMQNTLNKKATERGDFYQFYALFIKEAGNCKSLIYNSKTTLCLTFSNENIYYSFKDSLIIRTINSQSDSFYVNLNNVKFKFSGEEQEIKSFPVDEVSFDYLLSGSRLKFFFLKDYSSDFYINNNL